MKKIMMILLFIFFTIPIFAQDNNYCKDQSSWNDWDELVQKYPHNLDIQMLHAVRIGFCKKIEDGTISFKVARDSFNHLHEIVVKKAKQEQQQQLENKQL
jgi:hypothetical protein